MKVNVEIELSFVNEDETLEEAFEGEVKQALINRLESVMVNTYKPLIDEAFNIKVEEITESILTGYINKPITISNGYKIEEYPSLIDMVETKFTSLYDEKFRNKNGCITDPIFEKIKNHIDSKVISMIDAFGSTIKREGDKIAKEAIENSALSKAIQNIIKD